VEFRLLWTPKVNREKIDKNNRFENYRESLRPVLGQKFFFLKIRKPIIFARESRLSGEYFLKKKINSEVAWVRLEFLRFFM
jgi:hypothetical protein